MPDLSPTSSNAVKNYTGSLNTISEGGAPPRSRITDAMQAWQIFTALQLEYDEKSQYHAQIRGLIDGNPPYDQSKLADLGQGWRSNLNFREGEAAMEANAASLWELEMEVPALINASGDFSQKELEEVPGLLAIIEEEYTKTLLDWQDYFYHRMLCNYEMLVLGIGPIFWPSEFDWRFKSMKQAAFLVPSDTRASPGEIDLVFIRHTYRAHELFQKIKDKESIEASKEEGWDIEEIKSAIIFAAKFRSTREQRSQTNLWESLQEQLRHNDLAADYVSCDPIMVAHLLVTELETGKVSHYIIFEQEQRESFLFQKENRFEDMSHVVCPFLWNIGDGYYRGVKGLGHRIYPHLELSNRFNNTLVDSGIMSSSVFVKPSTGKGSQAFNLVRLGTITKLPVDWDVVQTSFNPRIDQMLGVRNVLEQILNTNTGVFKKSIGESNDGNRGPQVTATQANIEDRNSARFQKTQMNMFYLYLDRMHMEIYRRLSNKDYPELEPGYESAKLFRDRCKDRGVTQDMLERCRVRAMRAIGYGSGTMRDMVTQQVMGLSAGLDEMGRRNALQDRVASLVGYSMVSRYVSPYSRDKIPSEETSFAVLENNFMQMGRPTLVGVDQLHVIHLQTHLPPMLQAAQAFMQNPQQSDPMQLLSYLKVGIPHVEGHLQNLEADPSRKNLVKGFEEPMKFLEQVAKQAEKIAQRIMQAQQQQQQQQQEMMQQAQNVLQDRKHQEIMKELQDNFDLKQAKLQHQIQTSDVKTQHSMQLADQKTAAEISRNDMKAQAEVQRP